MSDNAGSCERDDKKITENIPESSNRYDFQKWNEFLQKEEKHHQEKNDSEDEEYIDASSNISGTMDEFDELELDEESISNNYKDLTEEQLQKLKDEAISLKNEGNEHFKKAEHKEAIRIYTKALNVCPLQYSSDRAILFANRAAARISLDFKEEAVLDCNRAIELNPNYLKAVLRRAQLHRKLDNLEKSLEDYKKVMEIDKNNMEAREACATLPPEINEKNEKLKQEMFGKLKELGNMCLKPFGLSTENFKVVQDPNSGGYSINFEQNKS